MRKPKPKRPGFHWSHWDTRDLAINPDGRVVVRYFCKGQLVQTGLAEPAEAAEFKAKLAQVPRPLIR